MWTVALVSYLIAGVVAAPNNDPPGCNADNCLRAVRATRIATRPAEGTADCASYLLATVTPATS